MDTLKVYNKANVRIIQFDKKEKKNAIDYEMYTKTVNLLLYAAVDDNISVVVLTGTGDFYSSGNELNANPKNVDALLKAIEDFIKAIIVFPKILVAIVNGPAIGIAATTLPLFDFVYASEHAYFYTPFTRLGLVPEGCSSVTFPQIMGERMARKLLMLSYKMSAKEALQYGLVSQVYKPEELHNKSWENIENLLKLPKHSLLTTKMLMRGPHIQQLVEINKIEMEEIKNISKKIYNSKL